jgi:hypothetical protein
LGSAARGGAGISVTGFSSKTRDCISISATGSERGIAFGSDIQSPVNTWRAGEITAWPSEGYARRMGFGERALLPDPGMRPGYQKIHAASVV